MPGIPLGLVKARAKVFVAVVVSKVWIELQAGGPVKVRAPHHMGDGTEKPPFVLPPANVLFPLAGDVVLPQKIPQGPAVHYPLWKARLVCPCNLAAGALDVDHRPVGKARFLQSLHQGQSGGALRAPKLDHIRQKGGQYPGESFFCIGIRR